MVLGRGCLTVCNGLCSSLSCIPDWYNRTVGTVGTGFVPGLIAVAVIAAVVVYIIKKQEKKFEAEYALKKKV